jgi:hypothetical protein
MECALAAQSFESALVLLGDVPEDGSDVRG